VHAKGSLSTRGKKKAGVNNGRGEKEKKKKKVNTGGAWGEKLNPDSKPA